MENIIPTSQINQLFYVVDKVPKSLKELKDYTLMGRYEKYEKYPDEIVREYMDSKLEAYKNEKIFLHETKNKVQVISKIKESMKSALKDLFNSRDIIYKTLMQLDLVLVTSPEISLSQDQFFKIFEEKKFSKFKIPFKKSLETLK